MAEVDYAAELLSPQAPPARAAEPETDYAKALFGPSLQRENAKKPKELSLSDLNIANAETHEGTADFTTLVKAGMVDDPGTKVKIFAKARFPKLDPKEAAARYGVVDGHVVYAGDDGKIYREDPPGFSGWLKDNLAAGTVANAPAVAGSVAGAVAGAPAGPMTMVLGGAAGAAAGKGYGKVMANLAFDEPQTVGGNIKSMLTEGVFTAGGNYAGVLFGKALSRNLARDIGKLDSAQVADLQAKAGALGVELDPAQLTNLPSLKAKKDVLASMPTSRDTIAGGAVKQSGQARGAVERFLDQVSPVDGLDEAGMQAREGAKKVLELLNKERSAKAAPLYKKAFDGFQGLPQELLPAAEGLMKRPAMKEAGKKALLLAKNEGIDLADPKNSLLGMHYMKLALDDMIEGAGQQGFGGTYKRGLVGVKKELLGIMDQLSPDYAKARETFGHFSPNITSVKEGVTTKLAELSDESTQKAAEMLFNPNASPYTVERVKNLFERAGMKDDYQAVLRAYLQTTFEKAGQQFKTAGGALEQSPNWQVAMTGNARQYRIIEKAMDPGQFKAFQDMMEVFQAMGRTAGAGAGSQTMPRQEGAKLLRDEAGSSIPSKVAKVIDVPGWGRRASEWLDEVRIGDHAEKLAKIMTSPDAMKKLKELKQLSPRSQRFIAGASSLFGIETHFALPKSVEQPADTSAQQ